MENSIVSFTAVGISIDSEAAKEASGACATAEALIVSLFPAGDSLPRVLLRACSALAEKYFMVAHEVLSRDVSGSHHISLRQTNAFCPVSLCTVMASGTLGILLMSSCSCQMHGSTTSPQEH